MTFIQAALTPIKIPDSQLHHSKGVQPIRVITIYGCPASKTRVTNLFSHETFLRFRRSRIFCRRR
jgi:hypothetical protein